MQAIKGFGVWLGGAVVALLFMYFVGAFRGNPAAFVFLGYIVFWIGQLFVFSTQVTRMAYDEGRLSNAPTYVAFVFNRLKPLYLFITALLLVDALLNVRLASNWFTFAGAFLVTFYLLRRDANRTQASNLLRGGRANVASEEQRREGPSGRYASIPQQQGVIGENTATPATTITATPDMSHVWREEGARDFDEWLRTASPEDLAAVRQQAESNQQQAPQQPKPTSRYAHLKDTEEK